MTLNLIDPIERISILFRLIQHYFNSSSIEFNIKLAIDFADTIDIVKNNKTIINRVINSEYSEQLNKLLLIILDYYPKILKDLNKTDININNVVHYYNNNNTINKNIHIVNCNNEYNEIDYLLNYISNNINKNISVICMNEKILNLLTIRLDFENIKYNNNAQYNKNYYQISQIFKNKVAYYFNDSDEQNLIKITKLLSFMDTQKSNDSNINICDFYSLQYIKSSDVVFCLSVNNDTWQLKNNLCFSDMNYKYNIENIFNYILNNSKELYCVYSSVVNGKIAITSSILNKLEVNSHYNLDFINYSLQIKNSKTIKNDNILIPRVNNNLMVLSGSDIRDLLHNPDTFYFNNLLDLKTDNKCDTDNIYTLFKDIFYIHFNKNTNKTYNDILRNVEKLDSLYVKKFQQIIDWLNNNDIINNTFDYTLNNDLLETYINNNLIIKTHCDRIEINNNTINIKKYCINKSINKGNIMSGKESNLLTQALILKNNKIINEFSEINLEIITPVVNINCDNNIPISINKIKLSINEIDNYLENIIKALDIYKGKDITIDKNNIKLS